MSASGDDVSEMAAPSLLDDATIDALVRGDEVHPRHDDLAAFVAGVRATADRPPPSPSSTLATLMVAGPMITDRPGVRRRRTTRAAPARVPGRPLAVKIGAAVATAAAVVGAGAAGVLPAGADTVVRSAIEAVTPVEFTTGDQAPDSSTDEPERLSDAPGAVPGDRSMDQPSGQGADGADGEPRRDADGTSGEGSRRDPRSGATIGGPGGDPATSGDSARRDGDRADDVPGVGVPDGDRDTAESDDDRDGSEPDGTASRDDGRQDDSPADVADQDITPRPPSRTPWPRPATGTTRPAPTAPRSSSPTGP